jgi:hypothetical protein
VKTSLPIFICLLLTLHPLIANQTSPATLLPDPVIAALAQELSGEIAKSNLEYIACHHRMRGSKGFHAAAEHIVKQLRDYGLTDASALILEYRRTHGCAQHPLHRQGHVRSVEVPRVYYDLRTRVGTLNDTQCSQAIVFSAQILSGYFSRNSWGSSPSTAWSFVVL